MIEKLAVNIAQVRDKLLPRVVKTQIDKMAYNFTTPQIKKNVLLHSNFEGTPVFCIVHYNAPEFLLLNVNQIEALYPKSKIYVLDNGSQQANIGAVIKGLKKYHNITLFVASTGNWQTRIGMNRLLYSHTKGLQFLLNYAAEEQDEIAVFLDQDCILSRDIDELFSQFGREVLLIGPRHLNNLVHASFMVLQPKRINQLFGKFSFFHEHTNSTEPYHGLSFKTKGKILFLEDAVHGEIPPLTSISFQGNVCAWHAWYSARLPPQIPKVLSSLWLEKVRKPAFEFMEQIHRKTISAHASLN